jgi:TctA family transporter
MLLETLMMLLDPVIIFSIFAGVSAGLFVGAMPGLSATMALAVLLPFTFTLPPLHGLVAYNEAKRAPKHPEKFGTGAPEGLVATESSNNVTVAGSMVPLLTLGIPGALPDAVILGVLLLHGLRPGIELFTTSGHLTYGFIISMGFAAVAMVPVGLLGGRLIYKVIFRTPYYFLVPTIAMGYHPGDVCRTQQPHRRGHHAHPRHHGAFT